MNQRDPKYESVLIFTRSLNARWANYGALKTDTHCFKNVPCTYFDFLDVPSFKEFFLYPSISTDLLKETLDIFCTKKGENGSRKCAS